MLWPQQLLFFFLYLLTFILSLISSVLSLFWLLTATTCTLQQGLDTFFEDLSSRLNSSARISWLRACACFCTPFFSHLFRTTHLRTLLHPYCLLFLIKKNNCWCSSWAHNLLDWLSLFFPQQFYFSTIFTQKLANSHLHQSYLSTEYRKQTQQTHQ